MDAGVGERLPLVVVGVVIWVRLSLFTGKEDAMGGSVIVGICLGVYDGKLALSCGEQEELLDCCPEICPAARWLARKAAARATSVG